MAAYSGIYIRSLAFLLMVYGPVKRHRRREQEHLGESTAIGNLHTGFELPFWRGEFLVKRLDAYLIYVVTYTLFADVKSKLVVWMVIAAVMLAIQCGALPFDGWANGLADHVEIIGLMARFASLFLAMPAFLNVSSPWLCVILASLVLAFKRGLHPSSGPGPHRRDGLAQRRRQAGQGRHRRRVRGGGAGRRDCDRQPPRAPPRAGRSSAS